MEEFKIISVIELFKKHRKFSKKNDVLELLMNLKSSVEFNATVDWSKLYRELGELYKDPLPYYHGERFTPEMLDRATMGDKDVFVFGSNTEGRHGGGAAKEALGHYGAIYGQARGLQGRSYAIVTKDISTYKDNNNERSIPVADIEKEIQDLLWFAYENQDLTFHVTKIGCGLGGFTVADIAPLFGNKVIPANVILPEEFVNPRFYSTCFYSPGQNKYYYVKDEKKIVIVNNNDKKYGITEYVMESSISTDMLPSDVAVCDYDDYMTATKYVIGKIH